MKSKHRITIKLILIGICIGIVFLLTRKELYISNQTEYLSQFNSLNEIYESKDDSIVTHKFSDNSWVAMKFEYACCGGEGFACIVARDEKNNFYVNKDLSICGVESSGELFRHIEAKSSSDFFKNSKMYRNLTFTKRKGTD